MIIVYLNILTIIYIYVQYYIFETIILKKETKTIPIMFNEEALYTICES